MTELPAARAGPTLWHTKLRGKLNGLMATTTPHGNPEPGFDACALAEAAGAGLVGRGLTRQVPALKDLFVDALAHDGFSFVEVISDCTEIYGHKNDLGSSATMVMNQVAAMRPEAASNVVDRPFRPTALRTGVLTKNARPEYGAAWRAHCARVNG